MERLWFKIFLFSLLLTLVLAPFAGFAPLLLFLLVAGVLWIARSLLQVFLTGEPLED
jgi:hypothetical protein